jgi:hypothetical protein
MNKKLSYREFLQTPEWKQCSESIALQAENYCDKCGRFAWNGNCHHTTYRYGWLPHPSLWTLVFRWLCFDCHKEIHRK